MAKRYGQVSVDHQGGVVIGELDADGRVPNGYTRGMRVAANPFSCCGLATLSAFGAAPLTPTFADQAAYLSALSINCGSGKQHVVFVVNPSNKFTPDFKLLVKAGAKKIAEFPNLQPGHEGYLLEIWLWNPNDAIGIFFSKDRVAFTEDPSIQKVTPPAAPVAPKAVKVRTVFADNPSSF